MLKLKKEPLAEVLFYCKIIKTKAPTKYIKTLFGSFLAQNLNRREI